MTVSVRLGRPNGAASSFLSGIVREPLAGQEAVCPVHRGTAVALASLASLANTVAGIVAVAEASREAFGGRTALNLPALTVTVEQMLEALRAIGGDAAVARVRFEPDAAIAGIVGGWPSRFSSARAERLGLKSDPDFRSVVLQYARAHTDLKCEETPWPLHARPARSGHRGIGRRRAGHRPGLPQQARQADRAIPARRRCGPVRAHCAGRAGQGAGPAGGDVLVENPALPVNNQVQALPAVRDSFANAGLTPVGGTPDSFARYIGGQITQWTKIAKDVGAVAE